MSLPVFRHLRRIVVVAVTFTVAGLSIVASGAADGAPAAPRPALASAPAPTSSIASAPTPPVEWLPLRNSADGSGLKVGCTFRSRGSQFGYECAGHHDRWALDLIAPTGTPVYAVRAGYATNATGASGSSGYGNLVEVDHLDGVRTRYAHLSKVMVPAEGMWVNENSVIGLVGSTGSSSAPHLHYEKQIEGQDGPTDPGKLQACVLGRSVVYPDAGGTDTWQGIQWGAFPIGSEGTACAPAAPAVAVSRSGTLDVELPTQDLLEAVFRAALAADAAGPATS